MAVASGAIQADLRIGASVAAAQPLQANAKIANRGVQLLAPGFVVSPAELASLEGSDRLSRPYLNGKDLADRTRAVLVLDTFGLSMDDLRQRHGVVFQWLLERAKPVRDLNAREAYRRQWWLFGENQPAMREALAGLRQYVATPVTAKHRFFVFLDAQTLPDQAPATIASSDSLHLGVLSSQVHVSWALAAGGTLEDRPRYNLSRCFATFPFPSDDTGLTAELAERIRSLAEQIDAHRKARQALHDDVTLTGLYNVLARLRAGEPLSAKEKLLHEHGLVSVLRSLHDELDAAVLQSYGWADLTAPLANHTPLAAEARAVAVETLLERLVALNAKRAAEEAAGTVRWLRPDFQQRGTDGMPTAITAGDDVEIATAQPAAPLPKQPWPAGLPEQIKGIADMLAAQPRPLALADLEARFAARGRWRERLPVILDTLAALGRARRLEGAPVRWQAA